MGGVPTVSESWQRAFRWIEGEVGGRIVRAERQPRWRPAWFLDLERDGETLPLYFRGERAESEPGNDMLEHEIRVLKVLEDHGIPVPRVYGLCPDPKGIVMERSRGRANLATADSDDEREAVLDDYMEILARIHQIEISDLESLQIEPPATPEALGLADFARWEGSYRKDKVRSEPILEFLVGWVHRNVPPGRSRASLICTDSGQFLFDRGRVTAVIDLELATLGDPMADLAGMISRDLSEPLGDLERAFRRYEQLSGHPLDLDAIGYHAVRFCTVTPLAVAHWVASPPAGADFVQYLSWYSVWLRAPLEIIADRLGVEIEPVECPEPDPTWHSPAHDALRAMLAPPAASDGEDAFAKYQLDAAARVAEYLRRLERFGPALEAQDLDDAAVVLGRRPADWREADRLLEHWVERAGPNDEEQAVRLFHRRLQRLEWILGPTLRELEGVAVQRIG